MILKVPHDVPVENEMILLSKNMTPAKRETLRFSVASEARYCPVFKSTVTFPMAKAKSSIISKEAMEDSIKIITPIK